MPSAATRARSHPAPSPPNGTDAPTASSSTEFVGLTIAGKKYPINVAPNTGINIPGVARVVINASQTATSGKSVATQGAGLFVTLLKARNGVAAGAYDRPEPDLHPDHACH